MSRKSCISYIISLIAMLFTGCVSNKNHAPIISEVTAAPNPVKIGRLTLVCCQAWDEDGDTLDYLWKNAADTSSTWPKQSFRWQPPYAPGDYTLQLIVSDQYGAEVCTTLVIHVFQNHGPVITDVTASPNPVALNQSTLITCTAQDEDNDPLSFEWYSCYDGVVYTTQSFNWQAPPIEGDYEFVLSVDDGRGGVAYNTLIVHVISLLFKM